MSSFLNVTDNGNVGIGTTADPTEKLEVTGKVKAGAFVGDGSELTGIETGKWSEGGGGIFYDGGNVGIGTTTPSEKLRVAGNLQLNDGRAEIYAQDRNHMMVLRGLQDGTAEDSTAYYQYGGTLAQEKGHRFFTGGVVASQTEKLRVSNDGIYMAGNVGIGTTTPGAKLDVAGTIKATGLDISGSLSLPGSDLIFLNLPDARTSPADADLETVVVDKATGKLYMQ